MNELKFPDAVTASPEHLQSCAEADWNEDYRVLADRFRTKLGQYFPHLADNLGACAFECNWFHSGIYTNPTETFKRTDAKRQMRQIRKAVSNLASLDLGYWLEMSMNFPGKEPVDDTDALMRAIHDFIGTLDELTDKAALRSADLNAALNDYERRYYGAIANVPDRRNINWSAVDAAYRLRGLWWRNTGQNAPQNALNPESTYANFMRDAFDVFGIDGDPVSAFRRYAALAKDGTYSHY